MDDEDEMWIQQRREKGRRAQRREHDAHLEAGHLRAFYAAQDWPDPDRLTFKQLTRANRHSCHAGCCRWSAYVKRADRRSVRHQTRIALAKGYALYRRKVHWASEASYKGT